MTEYDVTDVGGAAMLELACCAWDRAEGCRVRIDQDGEIVKGREHPLLKAELANRSFCVRTLQKLGLNFEPVRLTSGRPPGWA